MNESDAQQLATPQSRNMRTPATIASATVIAPTTKLTFVTGTAQVETITPPVTGYHELVFIFTGTPGALLATGNIHAAYTPIQNQAFVLYYDPSTAKYWRPAVT